MQDKKPDAPVSDGSNLVIVTTPEYVKESIKEAIVEHAASRNHPYATQVDPGFVTLSNETDSDSEITAATSKAVKKAYDLANTANQNALNNNSDLYLEKKQNGADIPDKAKFIKNIDAVSGSGGDYDSYFRFQQVETLPTERNATMLVSAPSGPKPTDTQVSYTSYGWYDNYVHTGIIRGGSTDIHGYAIDINDMRALTVTENTVITGDIHIKTSNYGGILSYRDNGTYWRIEGGPDDIPALINFIDRYPDGKNRSVQSLPHGTGYIMSTSHYYVDTSGFVKTISPIIKLRSDGSFETNDISKGATVERLLKGIYLIKGAMGFNNSDAIGSIEVPQCQNNLPLIWVNHEVLPDNSIKLMIYHREHSDAPAFARNIREGYADGDLIDIPDGRFVSVRVQMPDTK